MVYSNATGGADGASPPRRGHALLKMAQLRRATLAESCWRKRLRSLRMRHMSPSFSVRASFSAKAVVKY